MGLKELLFKPRWQHKDPAVRAWAVARSDEAALLEKLEDIALSDPDAAVRLAALKRLDGFAPAAKLAFDDASTDVRDYALRQVMKGLLSKTADEDLPARVAALARIEDSKLIEQLAQRAASDALRGAAQERVTREGLLGDLAIGDASRELRHAAAERVTHASTLKRIADKVRTSDKALYKSITRRLSKLEGQREETREQTILDLCQALERLQTSDEPKAQKQQAQEDLAARWEQLAERGPISDELLARWNGARHILNQALADPSTASVENQQPQVEQLLARIRVARTSDRLEAVEDLLRQGQLLVAELTAPNWRKQLDEALAELTQRREQLLAEQNPDPTLLRLCEQAEKPRGAKTSLTQLRTQWQQAWQALKTHNAAEQALKKRFDSALESRATARADAAQKREAAAAALEEALAELEQAVEAGDLQTAARILERCQEKLKAAGGKHPRQAVLNELRGRVRELRQWQHWSNNEVRQRLVGHAGAIAGSGMHPDAVAARVKELRQRWKALDASERLPGDRPGRLPNPKLFRQFQEACDAAFEPARPYFEKRAELRDEHLKDLIEICEKLEATESDGSNWDELARQVGTARRSLRRLRKVPHKERAALARRLRAGADRLDDLLKDHYEVVERRKQAVIRDVTALIEEPDLKQAIDQAKAAQKRWQAAGRLPRRREQKLWETYCAAADQVFGRLDQEKAAQRAERAADREKLEALIGEAQALDPTDANVSRAVDLLHQRWREAGAGDRRLEQRFGEAMDKVAAAADQHRRGEAAAARERWRELAILCHALEQGQESDLEPLKSSVEDSAVPAALRARCERLLSETTANDADRSAQHEALLELCIQAEFLAGLETPADFSEARMAYQVKRLSDRMGGGGEAQSLEDEADALEQRWLGLGPLPSDGDAAQQRMLTALRKLDESR